MRFCCWRGKKERWQFVLFPLREANPVPYFRYFSSRDRTASHSNFFGHSSWREMADAAAATKNLLVRGGIAAGTTGAMMQYWLLDPPKEYRAIPSLTFGAAKPAGTDWQRIIICVESFHCHLSFVIVVVVVIVPVRFDSSVHFLPLLPPLPGLVVIRCFRCACSCRWSVVHWIIVIDAGQMSSSSTTIRAVDQSCPLILFFSSFGNTPFFIFLGMGAFERRASLDPFFLFIAYMR